MKSRLHVILLMVILIVFQLSCKNSDVSNLASNNVVPVPRAVVATGEYFTLNSMTKIVSGESGELEVMASILASDISNLGGLETEVLSGGKTKRTNTIELRISDGELFGDEGYRLDIQKRRIIISANSAGGLFNGTRTLLQIAILDGKKEVTGKVKLFIPTGIIEDFPEFSYRGAMLDVARHFFKVEDVKRYIDLISLYKINILHLHLSDDQGWRIEIKSWPKLTEIGGSTEVGGGEGGFYTQEEYKAIIKYAADRNITIVPEIDMPGHTNAALASYPELNCSGIATELYTGTRVGFSTLCTDKEVTYTFIDEMIGELASLTPGPYLHIGGDESHVTAMEDYVPFINRVQEIVKSHGKTMIGWDEITHATLKDGSVAQYWASSENALRATSQGAQIILSPAQRCYLDMKYTEESPLGLNWAAYIEVDAAYSWDPIALVEGIGKENILGIESPLWAETIQTMDDIEYLAFPRLIGHSEIGWSSADLRDWDTYRIRLAQQGKLLDLLDVNYYRSPMIDWE